MKNYFKVALTGLVIILMLLSVVSCSPDEETAAAPEYEVATVQRGDLSVEITAVGNLALSRTEDLAFDLFYPKGTVEEVLVEAGDTVEEGQVVAKLDGEEWITKKAELGKIHLQKEKEYIERLQREGKISRVYQTLYGKKK